MLFGDHFVRRDVSYQFVTPGQPEKTFCQGEISGQGMRCHILSSHTNARLLVIRIDTDAVAYARQRQRLRDTRANAMRHNCGRFMQLILTGYHWLTGARSSSRSLTMTRNPYEGDDIAAAIIRHSYYLALR